jgi:hypothetical protein
MLRLRFTLSAVITGFLLSLFSLSAQAQDTTTTTVVEKRVIVTPAPKPVCTAVQAHWDGDVWVEAHNVCKYENRAEGVAWVSEYWSCTAASADGTCSTWTLVPGHWVKTLP